MNKKLKGWKKMNLNEIYTWLLDWYGQRKLWIGQVAGKLNITYAEANSLTRALGFYRGRALQVNSYESFSTDPEVQRIYRKMQAQKGDL